MKFTCEKDILLSAISSAIRAVSSKSHTEILKGLLFTANDGTLQITGYDLSLGIRSKAEADVAEEGSIVIDAHTAADIIKRLPAAPVSFSQKDMTVTISCGLSEFSLMAMQAETFPALPDIGENRIIHLPHRTLKAMLACTLFAVSQNDMGRVIQTGALFEARNGNLTIVAVDGYRLALSRASVNCGDVDTFHFVAPGATLRELQRVLSDSDEEQVAIRLGERHILFDISDSTYVSQLLDGEFLNYAKTIPKNSEHRYIFDAKAMCESIERVSLINDKKINLPVKLQFSAGNVQVSCAASIGKAHDRLPCEGDDDLTAGFNHHYLLDALKAVPDREICFEMGSPTSPAVLTSGKDDSWLFLVLPVRLRGGE